MWTTATTGRKLQDKVNTYFFCAPRRPAGGGQILDRTKCPRFHPIFLPDRTKCQRFALKKLYNTRFGASVYRKIRTNCFHRLFQHALEWSGNINMAFVLRRRRVPRLVYDFERFLIFFFTLIRLTCYYFNENKNYIKSSSFIRIYYF